MYDFSIGVVLDCFRTDITAALAQAQKLGISGVQVYAIEGEISPEMTPEARREFKNKVAAHGLTISALCGDLGHGFHNPDLNPTNIERSKRILDLAKELGTDIVTTHIGVVPNDPTHPRYGIMQDACGKLAEYADSIGSHFAVETGPEPAPVLKTFLDSLHSTGVAVNMDPANLAMAFKDTAAENVYMLRDYIVHTHAKDGVLLYPCDMELMYGIKPAPEDFDEYEYCREVPLGTGDVNWTEYLRALDDIGYHGYLTIERECGEDPAGDIKLAAEFLRARI